MLFRKIESASFNVNINDTDNLNYSPIPLTWSLDELKYRCFHSAAVRVEGTDLVPGRDASQHTRADDRTDYPHRTIPCAKDGTHTASKPEGTSSTAARMCR